MRWQACTLAVLAFSVLAGCPTGRKAAPKQIEVFITVGEGPEGKKVEIDTSEEHHDSVVVEPGDQIAWVCLDVSAGAAEPKPCPEDVEFAIDEIHYVGNLEQLVSTLRRRVVAPDAEQIAAVVADLQAVEPQPVAPAAPGEKGAPEVTSQEKDEAGASLMDGEVVFKGPIGDMALVLQGGGPAPPLFAGGAMRSIRFTDTDEPLEYTAGDEPILSPHVAGGVGDGLWKFTWRVRVKGVSGSEAVFDPHIYTHDDIDG